jgi:hypothetical protein
VLTAWSGIGTLDRNEAYTSSTSPGEVQALYDDAQTYQTMTNVFIATTATLGAAAVALAIFTDWNAFGGGDESATATLRPTFSAGPNGAVVGLGGDF